MPEPRDSKSNKNNQLLIILGNQLFPISEIKKTKAKIVFMAEDYSLCTEYKFHKLKILMFFCSMRAYRDELIKSGFKVYYHSIEDPDFKTPFNKKLNNTINLEKITKIKYFEIEDHSFEKKINDFKSISTIEWIQFSNPMFIYSREKFNSFTQQSKTLRMGNFYTKIRKELNILLDNNHNPIGGKWSFDDENRKKLPKNLPIPPQPKNIQIPDCEEIKKQIMIYFPNHPGTMDTVWFPVNREDAKNWLTDFLEQKFDKFGPYEDAIDIKNNFLFHSALSPLMNIGLLTPLEVIETTLLFSKKNDIPLNSTEGFIRQIIGWREFIRGVYHVHGDTQEQANFWNHNNKLTKDWYEGTTGIPPLDDTIQHCLEYGYTHHIPRLMVVANLMTLCRIHPNEIFRWFMEMFLDSSEWVMVPNVYGMGTFADGGLFSTKPYICGSNYLLKMSNYKKEDWCSVVDGLYWSFIEDNLAFFQKNPRLSIMPRALERINKDRKQSIFKKAQEFITTNTI
ncbi:MAG: cryptochrome/photolyase family protein [Paracoccaceae bacterium]